MKVVVPRGYASRRTDDQSKCDLNALVAHVRRRKVLGGNLKGIQLARFSRLPLNSDSSSAFISFD